MLATLTTAVATNAQEIINSYKLTPMLIHNANNYNRQKQMKRAKGTPMMPHATMALVKLAPGESDGLLKEQGCTVLKRINDIRVAIVPDNKIASLSTDNRVLRMEANPLPEILTDSTASVINANAAYNGTQLPQAFTGKGVVVGIDDVGFDFTHPMFLNADGTSRIKEAWDIYTGKGNGFLSIGSKYITSDDILAAGGTCDSLQHTHGTHVMGIAAGSPVLDGKYKGIAYESDIVASLAHLSGYTDSQLYTLGQDLYRLIEEKDSVFPPLYNTIGLSNAMHVLSIINAFEYAGKHNQPCVINLSYGAQLMFGNDYSLTEETFNNLVGKGRIIVCAAGNNSDSDIYRHKSRSERFDKTMYLKNRNCMLSFRSPISDSFMLKIIVDGNKPDTLRISSAALDTLAGKEYSDSANVGETEGVMHRLYTTAIATSNVERQTKDYLLALNFPQIVREIYEHTSLKLIVEGEADVDILGNENKLAFNQWSKSAATSNAPYTIAQPSAFSRMISVGATSHRQTVANLSGNEITAESSNLNPEGKIVSWSGTGPTLFETMKPDICAPGFNVVSAVNSFNPNESVSTAKNTIADIKTHDKTYFMQADCGTSMSAPVVTGVIALWLQADSTLTPEDIKNIMAETSTHPDETLNYPNYIYGMGEIDAYHGLLKILKIDSKIEGLPTYQPTDKHFAIRDGELIISGNTNTAVSIYNMNGQKVLTVSNAANGRVSLRGLPGGIYVVKLNNGSTLIRL